MKKSKILLIVTILFGGLFFTTNYINRGDNEQRVVRAVENDLNVKRDVTRGVVIHNDAGTISGSRYSYLKSYTETQLARGFAHYYVAKGDVYQFWDDSKVAWHTGSFVGNTEYIGVEVTNSYGAESSFLANEQEVFKLTANLLLKYGLPVNRETVRLHKEFYNTACPHRSWSLHGGSVNSVKDYFISQIQKYIPSASLDYRYKVGQNVQLVSTASQATDGTDITEEQRQEVGTIVGQSVTQHQGNGQYYESYSIKWPNGTVKNYVYFDLQQSVEANYPFKVGDQVMLLSSALYAVDGSKISENDKQMTGKIVTRSMMRHANGNYYPSYTVAWSNGKKQSYVYFDLTNKLQNKVPNNSETALANPIVNYSTHVENIGWQSYVKDGAMSGTSGKALRLEAIKINMTNLPVDGGIVYSTHVENIGWQTPVSNNQIAGTEGKALRLESINIKLTGELEKNYDIYYRVHIQNYGWLGWTSNGKNAGSVGKALRLEAIEIKIMKKGTNNIGLGNAYIS